MKKSIIVLACARKNRYFLARGVNWIHIWRIGRRADMPPVSWRGAWHSQQLRGRQHAQCFT
jgi:hypothetical protein